MPDKRAHRGPHPEDAASFAPSLWPALQRAVADLSWLLTQAYADKSALKLVGDHYNLTQRQRMAVMRSACSDAARARRREHEVPPAALAGQRLWLDGYNVLTTIEAALAGGILIEGRDGCLRDLASMHGTFRSVQETQPAIELLGRALAELGVVGAAWYLDRPVSNSGRLKATFQHVAQNNTWDWYVELVTNPDTVLAASTEIIVTADSVILDRCERWFNLARLVTRSAIPHARVVDLSPHPS